MEIVKRKIKTLIRGGIKLKFGDYVLFQEYKQKSYLQDEKQYIYEVTKPILAIYLGFFVADQTIGFNYVRWINENRTVYINNDYIKNYPTNKQVDDIEQHIEWNDCIDILGHWKVKPNWKQILNSYRKENINIFMKSNEIQW
jgi:hypothetical protein